jgi:hypothetical protein
MKESTTAEIIKNFLKKIWQYKVGYLPLHPDQK